MNYINQYIYIKENGTYDYGQNIITTRSISQIIISQQFAIYTPVGADN